MTHCPGDEVLVDLALGDGAPAAATQRHIEQCAACRARMTALHDDLALLRTALLDQPLPVARRRPRRAWLPLAATAAAGAAALVLWLRTPDPAPPAAPEVASAPAASAEFAYEVGAALFPGSADSTADDLGDSSALIAALNGGGYCDDPLGCADAELLEDYE